MHPPEFYRDRGQTYLKHFVLENYLERWAYNVFSFANELVYVDGFSGPWKNDGEDYSDTSFYIASHRLAEISAALGKRVRGIFVEHDLDRFENLKNAAASAPIEAQVLHGSFEQLVPDILKLVGSEFAFYFVDPTGWTGLALKRLSPLLKNRKAEVMINFMYDHVNRFIEHGPVRSSMSELFGGEVSNIPKGKEREEAILDLYKGRLREQGLGVLATSTRIKKPLEQRAYFHLVYATHHVKGLIEFKKVVELLAPAELEAWTKIRTDRESQSGQGDLFADLGLVPPPPKDPRTPVFKAEVDRCADQLFRQRLDAFDTYADVLAVLLEHPDIWNGDVEFATHRAISAGLISVPELTGKKRKLKPKHRIERRES